MTNSPMTAEQYKTILGDLRDPLFEVSLSSSRMLKSVSVDGKTVQVAIDLPTPAYTLKQELADRITTAVESQTAEVDEVQVEFAVNIRGKQTGGTIGLKVKNVIAVGSGKGGVGKSSMAAAIAYGLRELGAKVGLMDADVYGPSIPHMLNVSGQPDAKQVNDQVMRIMPMTAAGDMKVMSIGFFVKPEQAVVWRGPMLHKTLTQFLRDVEWGELDYLIIDLPPGTGDVSLTLSQLLGLAGAVIVCTPQQVALLDAVKAHSMFEQVRIPVLGMIENMSGEIFGQGGAKDKAAELGVPFLGEVPMESQIRIKGDEGTVSEWFAEGSPTREPLLAVTTELANQLARTLLTTNEMPTLEIL